MSRSVRSKTVILVGLALLAVGLQALLEATRAPQRQRDYELKLTAATIAYESMTALRRFRNMEGAELDLVNDPAGTGLVGPEFSPVTNARGDLDAKLTSLNPNFAAVMVEMFRNAGLKPGDPVAVALSGSFPGLNVCMLAALETMELAPVIVTSVGASMWGANDPEFTWLDMEHILLEERLLHVRSQAATLGGGDDMGRGLSPDGRRLLHKAIERNGVPLLPSDSIDDAIVQRMAFYEEAQRGRSYRCYVNVGGGVASLGSNRGRLLVTRGLSMSLTAENWPRKGTLALMADRGVPIVHVLEIEGLARDYGLPLAPDYLPEPGEGDIFVRDSYRLDLVALIFVLYAGLCIAVLAPQVKDELVNVWRIRRRRGDVS